MAIIHCPECNEKISSTVSQCVHCGVKIAVCPECKKIYTEKVNRCSECGYGFTEIGETKNDEKETGGTAPDIKRKWKTENSLNLVLEYLGTALSLISAAFLIFAVIKLFNWNNKLSDLENIMKTEEIYELVKKLLVLSITFGIAEKIYEDIEPTLTGVRFAIWANIRKINLSEVIKTTFSTDYRNTVEEEKDNISEDLIMTINSAFLSGNYSAKNKRIINHVVNAFFATVGYIFIYLFAVKNIEIFMQAELLQSDVMNNSGWSLSLIEGWWQLIVGIIILIFGYIYRTIVINRLNDQRGEWIKKTMPEYHENYRKIASNVDH